MATQVTESDTRSLVEELRRQVSGEVRFDKMPGPLYSTDASIYQIEPIGVVIPMSVEDVVSACCSLVFCYMPPNARSDEGGICRALKCRRARVVAREKCTRRCYTSFYANGVAMGYYRNLGPLGRGRLWGGQGTAFTSGDARARSYRLSNTHTCVDRRTGTGPGNPYAVPG